MTETPAPTPQGLREKAQQAIRLASGITDEKAKAALLAYAQELIDKAAQLEAATTVIVAPVGAVVETDTTATSTGSTSTGSTSTTDTEK
jgi:phosphotransacetylase